jgi:hypothetical protein
MLEDQKHIFRSKIADDSKMIAWGGEMILDRILKGDIQNIESTFVPYEEDDT